MGGRKGGRKIEFHDEHHTYMREMERDYRRRNREVLNLAQRLAIPVAEARKRLGITKPNLKTRWGKRKKRSKKK